MADDSESLMHSIIRVEEERRNNRCACYLCLFIVSTYLVQSQSLTWPKADGRHGFALVRPTFFRMAFVVAGGAEVRSQERG
jgi:hypothetical protein